MDITRGTGGTDIIDHERPVNSIFYVVTCVCVCVCACVNQASHNDGIHLRIDYRFIIVPLDYDIFIDLIYLPNS